MNKFQKATLTLAIASDGNPVLSTVTVMLFYLMFNTIAAGIETLIAGHRFYHWLDPFFQLAFIAYAAYAVQMCADYNASKKT